MSAGVIERTLVERLVREALGQRANGSTNGSSNGHAPAKGASKLVVNVSARHCHVTQEDLERLFGKGH